MIFNRINFNFKFEELGNLIKGLKIIHNVLYIGPNFKLEPEEGKIKIYGLRIEELQKRGKDQLLNDLGFQFEEPHGSTYLCLTYLI